MYKFKIIPNEQTPKTTEAVTHHDRKLLDKFLSFARRQHNCTGLASNQVSVDGKRIDKKFFAIKVGHFWDIIIHPDIIKYNGMKEEKIEGCLTWLGKKIIADRYHNIDVCYTNLKDQNIVRTITGFEAQVWQHEYNHLQGIEEKFI